MNLYRIEAQFISRGVIVGTEVYEIQARFEHEAKASALGYIAGSHYNAYPDVTYKLITLKVDRG